LHELPIEKRLAAVYFLCQMKVDAESNEFVQEAQSLRMKR
jgi:hypothetical protein